MLYVLLLTLIVVNVSAFRMTSIARPSMRVSMNAEGLVGSLAPIGFFDPLGYSKDKSQSEMKKVREAELKHGRVSMLAFLGKK